MSVRSKLLLAVLGATLWMSFLELLVWPMMSNLTPVYYIRRNRKTLRESPSEVHGSRRQMPTSDFKDESSLPALASLHLSVFSNLESTSMNFSNPTVLILGKASTNGSDDSTGQNAAQISLISDQFAVSTTDSVGVANKSEVWLNRTMGEVSSRVDRRLNQTWDRLVHADLQTHFNGSNATVYVSTESTESGMGNWMFKTATLIGLAHTNGRYPVLLHDYWAEKIFLNFNLEKRNRTVSSANNTAEIWDEMKEAACMKYTPAFANLSVIAPDRNIFFSGCLQSWKYFDQYRDHVKKLFTFNGAVYSESMAVIRRGLAGVVSKNTSQTGELVVPSLVGIHVRRGDILSETNKKFGFAPATEEYLLRTLLHVQITHAPVVFFVLSNDMGYCKKLFVESNFFFVENTSPQVDMAVVSLMDYVILSVGTFGWWSAYLSDAKEIYYFKDWPMNGSGLHGVFDHDDFFLPSWIPGA